MKILINAFSARLGGGQTYLKNLLAHIPAEMSIEILLYVPEGIVLPEDPRITRYTTRWPTQNPLMRALWEKLMLPGVLQKEKVQVLFCPGGIISTRVPASCQTVTMFRNMLPFDPASLSRLPFGLQKLRNLILKPVMLRSMKNADLTIFISKYARNIIEALTSVKNAVTIPHGINPAFKTDGTSLPRPNWLPASEYLLYVSRFDVYKHQFEVASAFAELPLELRRRYKLVLVGEAENELANRVIEMAEIKGIQDQIIVAGPIPYTELPCAYHHASVNLFASSCENCPNILLEALAAGRPVLSSDVMPMPEFADDAVEYFSPTDQSSIYRVMQRILRDKTRMEQLASRALVRSKNYEWESTARETWQQISALIAR